MLQNKYRIIENIRLRRDLTYQQLADEVDLNMVTLYNIINGRTDPHARSQYKIERWLNKQIIPAEKRHEKEI